MKIRGVTDSRLLRLVVCESGFSQRQAGAKCLRAVFGYVVIVAAFLVLWSASRSKGARPTKADWGRRDSKRVS